MMDHRQARFPLGHQIDLETLNHDPYPFFQRLLADEPVSWVAATDMWYVARRQDVIHVLNDAATYTVASPDNLIGDTFGACMLSTEDATQQRYRQPFAVALTPRRLRQKAIAQLELLAESIINEFAEVGTANLKSAFADRLALLAVTHVLGLPLDDFTTMRGWYHTFAQSLANYAGDVSVRSTGHAAVASFTAYVLAQRERICAVAPQSLLGQLFSHADHGLAEHEMIANLLVTTFGGLETTAAMLANTLWLLLTHPDQFAQVRHDPATWMHPAIEEALRYESPVQTATRHVVQPTQLDDIDLMPGDTVQCLLGAANRDPAFFADPDRFDIGRANADQHLAFGRGRHFCIGAALARLEGEIGLTQLIVRLPGLRLDPLLAEAPYGHEFRAPRRLVAQWDVRSSA